MNAALNAFRTELRRIFTLRPVFSVLVIGVAIYTVFYPQPYLNEALRNIPVAVVDQDGTTASRELARRIDASADISVASVFADFPTAQREVFNRAASGVVVIPKYFERDLLHGRASPIAVYADASYFLIYQRVSGGINAVAQALGAEIEAARLVGLGIDPHIASAATTPLRLTAVPLFNPQGGYATYVLPAAFVLILQQTLLIGVGLLGTLGEQSPPVSGSAPQIILGKMCAYLLLQAVILPIYLLVLPYFYGLPRLGSIAPLIVLSIPFVISVAGLGMILAAIFRNPLSVQLATAAIGLPLFFLAGFAWPAEAMPDWTRWLAMLVPSTSAIDGFVRVSQLGAPLHDIREQLLTLWGLAVLYIGIATLIEANRRRSPGPSSPLHPRTDATSVTRPDFLLSGERK
jgi:ABC-2 type transport system permease protein